MSLLTLLMLTTMLSVGAYFILSKHYGEMLIGVALASNGINLLLIESSHSGDDPLPQALILTAIVIGFSLLAFLSAFTLTRIDKNQSDEIKQNEEFKL